MSFSMASVRPEQGPPLSVPVAFFATGPLALVAAGVLALVRGDDGLGSIWGRTALAAAHLGTVGLLLFVMIGALYQLLPTVGGAVVPAIRLAHLVHALLAFGAGALVLGQAGGPVEAFRWASGALLAALVLFLVPAGVALARSRAPGPTVWGMRLALLALAAVGFAGLRLAWIRSGAATPAGLASPAGWLTLRIAHAHLGFLAWVGGLITAVSWQVVPMFFLGAAAPARLSWGVLCGLALSLLGLACVFLMPLQPAAVALLCVPAAAVVWGVQPLWLATSLRSRRRKRKDPTLWFWWAAIALAPACLALGAASAWSASRTVISLYGFTVIFGWAGLTVHGMLTRIAPFLVWLHRCAPHVGLRPVPSAKELLPDRQAAVGFAVHLATWLAGAAALAGAGPVAEKVFGAGLALTGLFLGAAVLRPVLRAPPRLE